MIRTQIDFTDEFYKRADMALALARIRDGFSGNRSNYIRDVIARKEPEIMRLVGFPELTPAPAPAPVPDEPQDVSSASERIEHIISQSRLRWRDTVKKPPADITYTDMGPVIPAHVFLKWVQQIKDKANGNISPNVLSFLEDKCGFADYGHAVMLTFPSETSMGSARYLENVCRRYRVDIPRISEPPSS